MNKYKILITSSLIIFIVVSVNFVAGNNIEKNKTTAINEQISSAKAINQQLHDSALNKEIVTINKPSVPSLSGVNHEANLLTDINGNLRVDQSIKELFEFYLSSIGEEPLDHVLMRIQSELNSQLDPPALEQALDLLKRYVDYKIELVTLEQALPSHGNSHSLNLENIKNKKSELNALRTSYFDKTKYQEFFEQEEIYDNFMIDHLEIVNNDTLDEDAKRQNIKSLEQSLPDELRTTRQKVSLHGSLYERTKKMKQEGSSDEEIFQLRAHTLGEQAAVSLAELDKKRSLWQQRLINYTHQRNAISDSGLSLQDQKNAINDLINANFSGTERLRVKALNSHL